MVKIEQPQNMDVATGNKVSDFPMNEENPFIKNMIRDMEPSKRLRMVAPTNREVVQTVVNNDSGEVTGHTAFMQFVEVDEQQFAKIYLSQMAAFWELTQPALRVFTYIMANIVPNQDKIFFDVEDAMKYTKYKSKTMVFQGLATLLKNAIIARGRRQYEYFINPLVVFNGNRVTFAKTYIKKKIKTTADESQLNLFGDVDSRGFKSLKNIAEKNNYLDHEPKPEAEE